MAQIIERKGRGNTFVGSAILRREDFRFLTGRGTYVGDVKAPGALHAVIVRSPVARGRVRAIDAGGALGLPGVVRVITAADVGAEIPVIGIRAEHQKVPGFAKFLQPVIAKDETRYAGEPVAVVVAESAALAEDGAQKIVLDIEPLPPVIDRYKALAGPPFVMAGAGTNEMARLRAVLGDADAAFATAPYRRKEKFRVQRHSAVMLEPRGLLAEWDDKAGTMKISGACKTPFLNRRNLARQMGLAEDKILMVENDVGGGFGVRGEFYPEDFLIPFAARLLKRPVRWTEDRREHFLASNHARGLEAELEIACAADGTMLALRGTIFADQGAYVRTNGPTAGRNAAQALAGPYGIRNIDIEAHLIATNTTPIGTYRGPGRFEGDFFRERLIDMAAADLGLDRVEMRRRNLIAAADIPWAHAAMEPYGGGEYDSGDYRETLARCLDLFGWEQKSALDGKLVDGRHHGIALGCYVEGGAAGPFETARIQMEPDGTVAVQIGSSSVGQGIETIFAQIAADALELPMSRVKEVRHGTTALVSDGIGSHASRSTVMGGSAIVMAAAAWREKILAESSRRLGVPAQSLVLGDGRVEGEGTSIPFADLAGISAEATFRNSRRTYAYGAHAAHVAVDAATGDVAVLDYAAVEDVGRIVNPLTLHGQALGAIVQGLGGALLEEMVHDEDGQLLAGSLADYLLPTVDRVPPLQSESLENHPSPVNPLGAKGAGEGGIVPVGGVIANAVASALRDFAVAPNALPLSPPRVWRMIEQAKTP